MNFFNFVELSHFLIDNYVEKGNIVADCTSGNGFDTLYLCNKMQGSGFIYSFDIQSEAIKRTRKVLDEKCSYTNYKIIKDSHENIDRHIEENLDFAIYNLGFLPNYDSQIKTNPKSTINSIKKTLKILKKRGILVITAYTGHDKAEEKNEVMEFLEKIDQNIFLAMNLKLVNVNKYPPELFIIQKNA